MDYISFMVRVSEFHNLLRKYVDSKMTVDKAMTVYKHYRRLLELADPSTALMIALDQAGYAWFTESDLFVDLVKEVVERGL